MMVENAGGSSDRGWRVVGVGVEVQPFIIDGLDVWAHEWRRTLEPDVELPHPSYRNQLHRMSVYSIEGCSREVVFATGELSANVWGFYVPARREPWPVRIWRKLRAIFDGPR